LTAELWQFGIMLAVFCAVLVLWLKIIYLPRRTLERWKAPVSKDSADESREVLNPPKTP